MKSIETLTPENFTPYGTLIAYTPAKNDGWEIVIRSNATGWRIALLEFTRKTTKRLEYHPESLETFEPMSGVTLLIVAPHEAPSEYEVFLLDQPICVNPGIWHDVITLSTVSTVKIVENLEVDCVYHYLNTPIGVQIVDQTSL